MKIATDRHQSTTLPTLHGQGLCDYGSITFEAVQLARNSVEVFENKGTRH